MKLEAKQRLLASRRVFKVGTYSGGFVDYDQPELEELLADATKARAGGIWQADNLPKWLDAACGSNKKKALETLKKIVEDETLTKLVFTYGGSSNAINGIKSLS